jgi:hypothetical protein
MAKKLIHFTAQFQGTIEVDIARGDSAEDIINNMTHAELFAACETDLNLDVDQVEAVVA